MKRVFTIAFAWLTGCGGGFEPARVVSPAPINADTAGDAAVRLPLNGSLPCDVASLLQTQCQDCHGKVPSGGAPMALVTYSDLTKIVKNETRAAECVTYMTSALMPPDSPATADQIAVLQNWIAAGYPSQSCGTPDGGVANDGAMSGGGDLSTPADFATPVDLSTSADLSAPADLTVACVPKGGDCTYHDDNACCSGYCIYKTNTCR